jgi:4-amino-4-deoxy-L-arabinose transferase-like glycosyltransferase
MDFQWTKINYKYFVEFLKKEKIQIILILIFSFLVRILFLSYLPLRGWDETVYLNLGKILSQNPFNYSLLNAGWTDYIPSTDPIYGWPNICFRAPILPYLFAIFYFLRLDFLIDLIVPLLGTATVFLVFVLAKNIFNKKVALYSALFLSILPIHVIYSTKTLTDVPVVFFLCLTFISFWLGYEKNIKKYQLYFGFFLALALLTRYTTLWIIPVFSVYFILRDRSLKFLINRNLWQTIGIFFLTLIPWFLYGLHYYGNPVGGFFHGFLGSSYWGGVQPWTFFIDYHWNIISILGIIFLISILYLFYTKDYQKKENYLLLIYFAIFFLIVSTMPHKEERFFLPLVPIICILSGLLISRIKRYSWLFVLLIFIILSFSTYSQIKKEFRYAHSGEIICFKEANNFLLKQDIGQSQIVINNQSPISYYYSNKMNYSFPEIWNLEKFKKDMEEKFPNKDIYLLFSNYDMAKQKEIKNDLDRNFDELFQCNKNGGYSVIYMHK